MKRRSQVLRFFVIFAIYFALIFVETHFDLYPFTILTPLSLTHSFIAAVVGGLCTGAYAVIRNRR